MRKIREGEVLLEGCYIGGEYCFEGNLVWTIEIVGEEVLHREDGPACIEYNEDGKVKREEYYINGNRHREEGPAWIGYNSDGKVGYEVYYLGGKLVSKGDELKYMSALEEYRMEEVWG